MHSRNLIAAITLSLVAAGTFACDSENTGQGKVKVSMYGESFVEMGIPAQEMSDGWAIKFDRFIVTAKQVAVAGVNIPVAQTIDLAVASSGMGHPIGNAMVPAGAHKAPSFAITRVEVSGKANKGNVHKSFNWVFDQNTHYANCETTTTVADQGVAAFQITMHADHFFYDSLVAAEPRLRFQALADADRNNDSMITRAELEAAGIGSYDPGSSAKVPNLWAWLVAQSQTLAHVDGEGHCNSHSHMH